MENKSQGMERNELPLMEFFLEELKDLYGAEKQLTKALPRLKEAATSPDLAMAFQDHLQVTENQITRLEQVFEILGEEPKAKKCDGIEGLMKEAETIISETEAGSATRDVGLIVSAQKVEHYEIAAYGSLRQLARTVNNAQVTALLEQTLQEEKETDMLLSNLAETLINQDARNEVR